MTPTLIVVAAERQYRRETGLTDAGQRAQRLDRLLLEARPRLALRVARPASANRAVQTLPALNPGPSLSSP